MLHPLVLMFAVSVWWTTPVSAGAWNQQAGKLYSKVWLHSVVGGLAYIEAAPSEPTGGLYTDLSLNVYMEYGVVDSFTLLLVGRPIGWASYNGDGRYNQTAYTGPIGLGFRWGWLPGRFKLALEGQYNYAPPLGEVRVGEGTVPSGRSWFFAPTTSTHRLQAELQAGYGFGFGKGYNGWLAAHAGFRYNSRPSLGSAVLGLLQFGVNMPFGLVLDLHFNLYLPLEPITTYNISGAGNTRYIGYGLTASYWFTKFAAVTLAVEGVVLAWANAATPAVMLGFEFKTP